MRRKVQNPPEEEVHRHEISVHGIHSIAIIGVHLRLLDEFPQALVELRVEEGEVVELDGLS